jgi:galactonate dehydratase
MIEDCAARYLVGRDPHDIETFFRRAYSSGFTQRPDVTMMGCVSALEMACWDIIGKEAGKPVYKLLGGQVHERCAPTPTSIRTPARPFRGPIGPRNVYNDPDLAAECALALCRAGLQRGEARPGRTLHRL